MTPDVTVGNDGLTLTIKCAKEIGKIIYGYDGTDENAKYTYGGVVRTVADIRGYSSNIGCYMPVQNIYG